LIDEEFGMVITTFFKEVVEMNSELWGEDNSFPLSMG
jgi:hypothetical protein